MLKRVFQVELVFLEIYKYNQNYQKGWEIFHWRSRDGEEIDFLIQKNPINLLFIESKVSPVSEKHPKEYREVKKVFKNKIPVLIICHQEGKQILNNKIPIAFLNKYFELTS